MITKRSRIKSKLDRNREKSRLRVANVYHFVTNKKMDLKRKLNPDQRRRLQARLNKARGDGKNSPFKLTGIRKK